MFKSDKNVFFLLLLIWGLAELIVNPIGDFPLNDDWAYAQNVYFLSVEGKALFSDWPAMSLVAQVIWGSLFCTIFGFSFTVLRISTLLLAFTGSWFFYRLMCEFHSEKKVAFFICLLLSFNPFYFSLANSFMTEVPFLCCFLLASLFYLKYFKTGENIFWAWALMASLLATMIRQPGLLVPLVFGIILLWRKKDKLGVKLIMKSFLPVLLCFLILQFYTIWLKETQTLPPTYGSIEKLFDPFSEGTLLSQWSSRNKNLFFFWGLFGWPLYIILFPAIWKKFDWKWIVLASFAGILLFANFYFDTSKFPSGNQFYNFGLGPKSLPQVMGSNFAAGTNLSFFWWNGLKGIGIVGAALLIFEFCLISIQHLKNFRQRLDPIPAFLVLILFGYYCFLILSPYFFDRYSLIAFPFLIAFLTYKQDLNFNWKRPAILSAICLSIIGFFSVLATHDYLSWNRARWKAIDEWVFENQRPVDQLNGGFEYQGWFSNREVRPKPEPIVKTEKHKLGLLENYCGYQLVNKYPYFIYLPPGKRFVSLHKEVKQSVYLTIECNTDKLKGNQLISSDQEVFFSAVEWRDSTIAHSGKYSLKLEKERAFAYTYKSDSILPCQFIKASVWRKSSDNNTGIVISGPGFYFFEGKAVIKRNKNGWEQIQSKIWVPAFSSPGEISIYVWNKSGVLTYVDDFSISISQ